MTLVSEKQAAYFDSSPRSWLPPCFREKASEAGGKAHHKIWQDIQAKNIFSPEFLRQKIDYIHTNPVQPQWQLVDNPEDWPYSSAGFYEGEQSPILPLTDVRSYLA